MEAEVAKLYASCVCQMQAWFGRLWRLFFGGFSGLCNMNAKSVTL